MGPLMAQDHADDDPVDLFSPDDEPGLPLVLEEPAGDVNVAKPKRHPGNPTKEELDKHNLTHANYRSWCAICNRAALKEDPHYRQTAEEIKKGLPCISFDYKTMGEADDHDDKIAAIVGRDRWTGVTFCTCCKRQGFS